MGRIGKVLPVKPKSILLLTVAFALTPALSCRADSPLGNPSALFKECYVPVMEKCFKASITKTLRGFVMRGDTNPENISAALPSDEGLFLDVEVRDAIEIPAFKDVTTTEGVLTKRTVSFPAFPAAQASDGSQGLLVTFIYGPNVNPAAIGAIGKCIGAIKKSSGEK